MLSNLEVTIHAIYKPNNKACSILSRDLNEVSSQQQQKNKTVMLVFHTLEC